MPIISNCTASTIKNAALALKQGHLVAFPTETVYGLGADATNEEAVARIYKVKGRPTDHPLIVHISSMELLDKWVIDIPEYAIKLASAFWPGPMTLVLPRAHIAKDFITGGQDTVAIRVPAHTLANQFLREFESLGGHGVAAPSANRFGKLSSTTAQDVYSDLCSYLRPNDLILDNNSTYIGIESTIINCTKSKPTILRPGALTSGDIQNKLGFFFESNFEGLNNEIKHSGSFQSHYSPKAKVIVDRKPSRGQGLVALDSYPTPPGVIRLATPKNNSEYAQILYSALRLGDSYRLATICVIAPTGEDIAVAIRDRIHKASQ
jgi:L-threonylcarbamoyladenylate synthase